MDGSSPAPSDNLFVSNLPEGMDDAMLQVVFGQYGTVVQCKTLPNMKGGHCSALVRFSSLEEATWICENLPGTIPQGLAEVVQVRYANTPPTGKGGGAFGGGDDRPSPYGGGAGGGKGGGGKMSYDGTKSKICTYWEQGTCTRGASCTFAHGPEELGRINRGFGGDDSLGGGGASFGDEGASNRGGVGGRWVTPMSTEPDASLGGSFGGKGGYKTSKDTACMFFKKGSCMKGEDCKFSHDPSILESDGSNGWEVAPGFSRAPGLGKGGPGPSGAAMLDGGFGKGFGKGGAGFDGGKGGKGKGDVVNMGMVVQGLFKSGCLPGGESYSNDENTLCVKGLPFDADDFSLYLIFSPFGAIAPRGIRAMLNTDGTCKGIGFINFLDPMASACAITTLNGCQLPDGSIMSVGVKREKGKGKGKGKDKEGGGIPDEAQAMAELEAALAAGDLDTLTALGLGDAFGLG